MMSRRSKSSRPNRAVRRRQQLARYRQQLALEQARLDHWAGRIRRVFPGFVRQQQRVERLVRRLTQLEAC